MANKIRQDGLSQSQIYENGELYSISIEELKGNEVAIRQLVNDYNTKVKTIEKLQKSETMLSSELQYQNANPFFASIAAVINIVGSVILCCGVNLITGNESVKMGIVFVIAGSILLLAGSIMTIFYKHVYDRVSRKSELNNEY